MECIHKSFSDVLVPLGVFRPIASLNNGSIFEQLEDEAGMALPTA